MTIRTAQIGWVICRTTASNWSEAKMDFAGYSEVSYDLYAVGQVGDDGLMQDSVPMATLTHGEFETLGLRDRVAWGAVACEISQGGAVRKAVL